MPIISQFYGILIYIYRVKGLSIEWDNGADICPDELYNLSKEI